MNTPSTALIDTIVADANALMLSALSEKVERDSRFSLVATVATAEDMFAMAMRVPVAVAVIDWTLPQMGGRRLVELLRAQEAAPRVVVYADEAGGETPRAALAAGAAGFCARSDPVETLLDTAADVAAGKMVFPFVDIRTVQADPMEQLTRREVAMLEALAEGRTNKELAEVFDLSVNTVKFHLSNLYDKLGVKNRTKAIAVYFASRMDAPSRH